MLPAFMAARVPLRHRAFRGAGPAPRCGRHAHRRGRWPGRSVPSRSYVCTAMIYACLAFLREWASAADARSTSRSLGSASGFTLAAAFAATAAPGRRSGFWPAGRSRSRCCGRGRARRLARAQRATAAEVDAADGDRRQASAHRPEIDGLHGRLVQHARILSRPLAQRRCARVKGSFSRWHSSIPCAAARRGCRGGSPVVVAAVAFVVQFPACLRSAGTSSPKRTIRRISTIRRSPRHNAAR